jgi:hypothetical protein
MTGHQKGIGTMEFVSQPVATRADEDRRRRRRGLIALLLGLSVLTLGSGVFSLAVFQSSDTSAGNFSTGTIVLDVSPVTVFNATNIFPGDSGSATVNVANTGTGALRYAMTSTSTDPDGLGDEINLVIRPGACPSVAAAIYTGDVDDALFGNPAQGDHPLAGDRTLASGANENLCFSWDLPLSTATTFQGTSVSTTFTFLAEQTANNP